MVATQSFSISRRTLDVEDYIDIVRRHAGWIVGPAFAGIVASVVVAFLLPNSYISHATMEITPAQISENIVQSTITTALNERIQQMQTNIMSRTNLSSIINDPRLMLYKDDLKTRPLEDVIDDMKKDITISYVTLPGALGKGASAFNISFIYPDKYKAQQTVTTLISKFEEENQTSQKSQQDMVKGYVGDQLTKARADLDDANNKLTAFKQSNAGKLPEQAQINIAQTSALTAKMQTNAEQIYRQEQSLDALKTQKAQSKARLELLDMEETQADASSAGNPSSQPNVELMSLDKSIDSLKFSLEQLHKSFSDKYPDIRNAQKMLESYQARRDALAEHLRAKAEADAAKPKDTTPKLTDPKVADRRLSITQDMEGIDKSVEMISANIDHLKKEQETYRADSDAYSQKLKDSTGLEADYDELRRSQMMAQTTYTDLLTKQQKAEAESQLIQRKGGEILQVLDPASLPVAPAKPNRYLIVGAGFAMSMILGLGLAGLQEAKDTSLKNLKDVRAYTNLPVLCSIPLLENTMLVKRKRRLTYLAWSAAVILGAAAVTGAVFYYYSVTMKA